jgi:hypothetical protein
MSKTINDHFTQALEALKPFADLFSWAEKNQPENVNMGGNLDCFVAVADARQAAYAYNDLNKLLSQEQHPDDVAIDAFTSAMKAKMKKQREKGYGGWSNKEECPTERVQAMLCEHIGKGDPVDVGNFAMMLFSRGEKTVATKQSPFAPITADDVPDGVTKQLWNLGLLTTSKGRQVKETVAIVVNAYRAWGK